MPRKLYPLSFIIVIFAALLSGCANLPDQLVDKSGAKMALVPAGEFEMTIWDEMKNEYSTETVHVEDFYIDIYEVTNQLFAECVGDGVCAEPAHTLEYSEAEYINHPVVFVTWDMANSYCLWRDARLPTKAEWEKAAGDELSEIDQFLGDSSPLCQVGSRMGSAVDTRTDYDPDTEPVGASGPNAIGLYDMVGSMWEWVGDKHVLDVYEYSPEYVSFLRINRWSGYGPLYNRYLCSFRCARTP